MKHYLLIKNARIVDTLEKKIVDSDILIDLSGGGVIERIEENIDSSEFQTLSIVSAENNLVCRSFADLYSNSGEQARIKKDSLALTVESAMAGGYSDVVTVSEIPEKSNDSSIVKYIRSHTKDYKCNVYPTAHIYREFKTGAMLSDFRSLMEDGANIFTDAFLKSENPGIVRSAMKTCAKLGVPIIMKEAESSVSGNGIVSEGSISRNYRLEGIPESAEEIAVSRNVILAKETGCRVHLALLSCASSIETVRRAKKEGVNITCSVSPNSFMFTENDIVFYGSNALFSPPLRKEKDRDAIIEGIADGTVDAIVSDHSPCLTFEKISDLSKSSYGAVTFQTVFPSIVENLLRKGIIDIFRLVELLSDSPLRILGSKAGINAGEKASINILYLDKPCRITEEFLKSTAKNTPLIGSTLHGIVKPVILNGNLV